MHVALMVRLDGTATACNNMVVAHWFVASDKCFYNYLSPTPHACCIIVFLSHPRLLRSGITLKKEQSRTSGLSSTKAAAFVLGLRIAPTEPPATSGAHAQTAARWAWNPRPTLATTSTLLPTLLSLVVLPVQFMSLVTLTTSGVLTSQAQRVLLASQTLASTWIWTSLLR